MSADDWLPVTSAGLTTIRVRPGRLRLLGWAVVASTFSAGALVAAVWLLIKSGLRPGVLEAAGVLCLSVAATSGPLGMVGLRGDPRGVLRVTHRGESLYVPGVLGGARAFRFGAWCGLLCALPLIHARLAGVGIGGSSMLTLGLWLGIALGVLALTGRATNNPPGTVGAWLRLDPDGVEYSWAKGRAEHAWDDLPPMSTGRRPVGDVLAPGDRTAGATMLASDPDAVARLLEHYRTHPEHRAELATPDVITVLHERADGRDDA